MVSQKFDRAIAQLVERTVRDRKAGSSSLPSPTKLDIESFRKKVRARFARPAFGMWRCVRNYTHPPGYELN